MKVVSIICFSLKLISASNHFISFVHHFKKQWKLVEHLELGTYNFQRDGKGSKRISIVCASLELVYAHVYFVRVAL